MYVTQDPQEHHAIYFDLVRDLLIAMPSSAVAIQEINNHILNGDYYKALKESKRLITHESELIALAKEEINGTTSGSLRGAA